MGKRLAPSQERKSGRAKRQKYSLKEDRLSGLHDSLLTHILSFLPTKDAVRTGVLSRRWFDVWASVPALDFSVENQSDMNFIQAVLSRRNGVDVNLSRFHVLLSDTWRGPSLTHYVDYLVDYAVEHSAANVKIVMQPEEDNEVIFLDRLLNHRPLESLELDLMMQDSIFDDPIRLLSRSGLPKLRVLDIKMCGKISGESLAGLLPNCPVLEELYLDSWFDGVDISSSSLKKLHLTVQNSTDIKISCPNLELSNWPDNQSYGQDGLGNFQGHVHAG